MSTLVSRLAVVLVSVTVVLWCLLWGGAGMVVGNGIRRLDALGDGLVSAGEGVQHAATAFSGMQDLPFVGEHIASVSTSLRGIGQSAIRRGTQGKQDVHDAAFAVQATVALGPTVLPCFLWVVFVLGWMRDRRRWQRGLAARDPAVLGFLAWRAVSTRPFQDLKAVSQDPVGDLLARRHDALAAFEARCMGLPA